jgi:membrane protein CcdC involved in cytochrome C biogenesis
VEHSSGTAITSSLAEATIITVVFTATIIVADSKTGIEVQGVEIKLQRQSTRVVVVLALLLSPLGSVFAQILVTQIPSRRG